MRGSLRITSVVLWAVLFGLAGYYAYLILNRPVPCAEPITYRIGTLDPRFGVSTSTFMADIASASTIWDNDIGRTLFAYDPRGEVVINLIYDNRQAATDQEHVLQTQIKSSTAVADSVKAEYQSLTTAYNQSLDAYNADLAKFQQAQASYNSRVDYWNGRGGAPRQEYVALQSQEAELQSERSSLESERQKVNDLAAQVNALIDKYNLLVSHINANVQTYNSDGLAGTQFEEGGYVREGFSQHVDIYQFDNKTFFIRVIAHELGHALGLDHNSNPDSIMNPINSSTSLTLSPEDLAALKTECNIK